MRDALGDVGRVVVLGGTSEIALAVLAALDLRPGASVVLAGRDPAALAAAGHGLPGVTVEHFDALDPVEAHFTLVERLFAAGDVDVVLAAAGVLGDQERAERDTAHALEVLQVNLLGQVSVLLPVANRLRAQGHGTLVVLSSVAAVRARRANFVYGASKAGLDAFASGLGDALAGSGARVLVVRPGFVHTKMTEGMAPAPLATTPEAVGSAVASALRSGSRETVWAPAPVRALAAVMRVVPRPVWRRLRS